MINIWNICLNSSRIRTGMSTTYRFYCAQPVHILKSFANIQPDRLLESAVEKRMERSKRVK
jgi:hypothetical protein